MCLLHRILYHVIAVEAGAHQTVLAPRWTMKLRGGMTKQYTEELKCDYLHVLPGPPTPPRSYVASSLRFHPRQSLVQPDTPL